MKMTPLQKLAATAFLATAFLVAGCNSATDQAISSPVDDTGISTQIIQKGDVVSHLPNGMQERVVKADQWSGDYDLHCMTMKDRLGTQGYGGLSCDFK